MIIYLTDFDVIMLEFVSWSCKLFGYFALKYLICMPYKV